MVNLSAGFLEANPDIHIQLGSRRQAVEPGWHFGSRYPGDPAKVMVYDFLPDVLLDKVVNAREFLGVLAFDKWIGNADARQSIFFRARLRQWSPAAASESRTAIGLCRSDDGPRLRFRRAALEVCRFSAPRPLLPSPASIKTCADCADFEPWLDRLVYFPEEIVDAAQKQIPPEWLAEDAAALEALLEKLMSRRRRVPDLIRDSRHGRVNPFPDWK